MKKFKEDKMICVSCFKLIKTKNLNRHYKTKTHKRNAKQMKLTFDDMLILKEDLKYISQRDEWEKEIEEMKLLENKIKEARDEMNNRTD